MHAPLHPLTHCRFIAKNTDIKVVFNGDGSDEASGSYLYFYNAPNDQEFEAEVERLLNDIHMFDVLRSDRSISSHGSFVRAHIYNHRIRVMDI